MTILLRDQCQIIRSNIIQRLHRVCVSVYMHIYGFVRMMNYIVYFIQLVLAKRKQKVKNTDDRLYELSYM